MSDYSKPKDRYLAALFVFAGFVCVPVTIALYLLASIKDAIVEAWWDLRREFKGGLVLTARYAHAAAMEGLAHRRARRQRLRGASE
jgi:hypothetical protein